MSATRWWSPPVCDSVLRTPRARILSERDGTDRRLIAAETDSRVDHRREDLTVDVDERTQHEREFADVSGLLLNRQIRRAGDEQHQPGKGEHENAQPVGNLHTVSHVATRRCRILHASSFPILALSGADLPLSLIHIFRAHETVLDLVCR